MRLKEIQDIFHAELDAIFGFNEVDSFFYILIEHYFKLPRFQLVIQPDYTITEKEQNSLLKALAALKEEQPIQYIIGETEFYGLPFKVNKHVLIPRPETEELVDWVIKDIEKVSLTDKTINILDIGTGSGCIAISLAKHIKNACVYAVDVSAEALTVAKQNSGQNEVNL
ncbi:MAG: HemK/PrmC family methyltransferase, partial [Bacteroidota bacterium]